MVTYGQGPRLPLDGSTAHVSRRCQRRPTGGCRACQTHAEFDAVRARMGELCGYGVTGNRAIDLEDRLT